MSILVVMRHESVAFRVLTYSDGGFIACALCAGSRPLRKNVQQALCCVACLGTSSMLAMHPRDISRICGEGILYWLKDTPSLVNILCTGRMLRLMPCLLAFFGAVPYMLPVLRQTHRLQHVILDVACNLDMVLHAGFAATIINAKLISLDMVNIRLSCASVHAFDRLSKLYTRSIHGLDFCDSTFFLSGGMNGTGFVLLQRIRLQRCQLPDDFVLMLRLKCPNLERIEIKDPRGWHTDALQSLSDFADACSPTWRWVSLEFRCSCLFFTPEALSGGCIQVHREHCDRFVQNSQSLEVFTLKINCMRTCCSRMLMATWAAKQWKEFYVVRQRSLMPW